MQIKDRSGETFCIAFAIRYQTSIRKWNKTCQKTQHKKHSLKLWRLIVYTYVGCIISHKVCASGEKNGSTTCSPNWQILLMIFFSTLYSRKNNSTIIINRRST